MKLRVLLCLLLLSGIILSSQEIPPIQKYTPQVTGSGNQNWMITQGGNENIYFANNKGLLEFNGSKWSLYPSPNGTIFRSVKRINERIYSGAYMDFGYWLPEENGILIYKSLVEELEIDILEDEQFWNILEFNKLVIFQSLDRLIIIDIENEVSEIIDPKGALLKSFKVGDQLYFVEDKNGLFVIEKGQPKLVTNSSIFKDQIILGVFNLDDKKIVVTNKSQFYNITDIKNIRTWKTKDQEVLSSLTLYSVEELSNGNLVLGTISNGVFEIDMKGDIVQKLNQNRGLSNNTVLSIFEDIENNTWVGLDNGINCINNASPFLEYKEEWDALGTVYSSQNHNGYNYIGTNRGLYVKEKSDESYSIIPETSGQVWNLKIIQNTLFCGHDKGTFLVDKKKVKKIGSQNGSWLFKEHPSRKDLILQGNYNGIHILEYKNNSWSYRNKLEGFDISSRLFEFVNDTTIIVGHEYKGVYTLQTDSSFKKITWQYKEKSVEKGFNAGLTSFDNEIYYYYKEGVFRYVKQKNKFIKDSLISSYLRNEEYDTGKMVADNLGRVWFMTKNKMHYFARDIFTNKLIHDSFYLERKNRKSISGFEHIAPMNKNNYLIGSNEGYISVDLSKVKKTAPKVRIDGITTKDSSRVSLKNSINISNNNNNLLFEYSANTYQKYYPVSYQYKLEGNNDAWSSWSEQAYVKFENLNSGTYTFNLRAKVRDEISETKKSKKILIEAPWYLSIRANIFYVLLFLLFITLLREYYARKNRKEQLRFIKKNNQKAELLELENQKEIIRIRNNQLQNDVESKNRELAIATMGTLKRNEFLNKIKKDLEEMETFPKVNKLIKKINKNLKNNEDWEYFEGAFNNADKDFFKKIKNKHSKLTNNDLRLCAFLRLNLSSKEIAPLLNISVHSVEIKRYRLRKKMNLSRDQRIVDYIMTL
tara:strand:- start:5521 stop:8307 length:2787 start_codon:yes stop_codon:yes gene_type:complete